MIEGIGHTASGTATVYESNGMFTVVLDPYSSQNGPDLKVYLSKDAEASDYIRLGNLKSVNGKQSYAVSGNPDLSQYHYVHVWCEKFTVVFARAGLN
jgi:Electron transfer DM13